MRRGLCSRWLLDDGNSWRCSDDRRRRNHRRRCSNHWPRRRNRLNSTGRNRGTGHNYTSDRRSVGNRRTGGRRCRRNDICALTRLRNNPARCRSLRHRCGRTRHNRCWNRSSRSGRGRNSRTGSAYGRCRRCGSRSRYHNRGTTLRRSILRRCLSIAPLQNRLQRVTRLRYARQVEALACRRLGRGSLARNAVAVLEVLAHPLGLVRLDRAGMRLPRHADRFKRIQNGLALYFQFSCQIVNANLRHPSLFALSAPLSCSYQPRRRRNIVHVPLSLR